MKRRSIIATILASLLVIVAVAPVAATDPHYPARINLPDGWAPEGITAGLGDSVFVGSLANGAIWRGNVRTGRGRVLVPGVAGNVAVGVEYEARRNRLWVAGGPTGKVRVYNASTGRLLKTYSFTGGADGIFLNDLVVTRNAVYVTDSKTQQLDVIPIRLDGGLVRQSRVRALPLSGDIAYVSGPNEFNANGIVARDGWLIIVQSNTGKLFRVNPRTGVARNINLHGASVSFGDGLELNRGTLYVVRNELNKVSVFRLGLALRSARFVRDMTRPSLDIPTTAALQAGRLWVVNARFGTPVTPDTDYWITRLPAPR
jgi:outer membrane protein assembly factor BamB